MSLQKQLWALEYQFWTGGPAFYLENVDGECLVAFSEMAGVMSKDEVASTIKDGRRWRDVSMEEKGFLKINDGVAMLTYRASATRADGEDYQALVSSGYVNRNDNWKLAFHQQTPSTT
jgi:hypothetical protein